MTEDIGVKGYCDGMLQALMPSIVGFGVSSRARRKDQRQRWPTRVDNCPDSVARHRKWEGSVARGEEWRWMAAT